jgi:hypothetical protein
VSFLKALRLADAVFAANVDPESEIRRLAGLLHDLAHAVWEPARATQAHRSYLAATLDNVQLAMCISPDWPIGGRQAKIRATIPQPPDAVNVHAALLQSGIVDFVVAAIHPRFEVRRCLECTSWFTRPARSGRSKFCVPRCRNAFHYRKRGGPMTLDCSLCLQPCSLDDVSGLELCGGLCTMSGLRMGRALLCIRCVRKHFAAWLPYAEGIV